MIFFYSRKLQCFLLFCWLLGMGYMFLQVLDEGPRLLAHQTGAPAAQPAGQPATPDVRLGRVPEVTPKELLPEKTPPPAPQPAADPHLNRFLALRAEQASTEGGGTLVLEMDFVPAQHKGFTPEKLQNYYLSDAPTLVLSLGESWVSDIGNVALPGGMEQVTGMNLIVSKSKHLRLQVHTRSMSLAMKATVQVTPTDTGLRAEVHLPK